MLKRTGHRFWERTGPGYDYGKVGRIKEKIVGGEEMREIERPAVIYKTSLKVIVEMERLTEPHTQAAKT